jgi:biotin carboxyl carrier protein
MIYEVTLGGVTRRVDVRRDGDDWLVALDDGAPRRVVGGRLDAATLRLALEGEAPRRVGVALAGDDAFVLDRSTPWRGTVIDPRAAALDLAGHGSHGVVATPMPGAVVRVLVVAGATVDAGQVLLVVEAMKMENEFKAPFAGTITRVAVAVGQAVEAGAVLCELDPAT